MNRELAGQYDIDVRMIGQVVQLVSKGLVIDQYRPDDADDEIDIIVRFPEPYRNLSQLDRLRVFSEGKQIPIGQYIKRRPVQKLATLRRVEGQRTYSLKADVEPGLNAAAKLQEIQSWIKEHPIDPSVTLNFRGEEEKQQEVAQFLKIAFLTALFLMGLILVTQFNSIYFALVIMSAVFLSTGGVLLGLLITWKPFGIVMCGVAVISLAGIVVNNNIIFIDTYQRMLARGLPVPEAILQTGLARLRPILLTAGTTVLGLLPMVLSMNIDFITREVTFGSPSSQWWVQLSTAIAGGLTFATILTLFFTPTLLMMQERAGRWWKKLRGMV